MAKCVIMEVVDGGVGHGDGTRKCIPKDVRHGEVMWLHPDRILEGTWRVWYPKAGETFLSHNAPFLSLQTTTRDIHEKRWILDPPAKDAPPVPMPDWEEKMREVLAKDGWPGGSIKDFMDALNEARHLWRKEKEGGE